MGFIGATLGSLVGWYLGALIGVSTGVVLSMVGTGAGIWAARQWLES